MSWAHVAAKNSQKPQEQEKPEASAGNEWVDVNTSDRFQGRIDIQGDKRQRQMALLEQALKSPQDAVSGARWCLGCGKKYNDVFTLAQHIKDKHGGINASEKSSDTGQRSQVVMSDYMFPRLGALHASSSPPHGRSSAVDKRNGASSSRIVPVKVHEARSTAQRGKRREKKMTTLKKAYLKQKAARMTHVWTEIIQLLTEKIDHVEELNEALEKQIEMFEETKCNTEPMWRELQTLKESQVILSDQLKQLLTMKTLCQEKLKLVEISLKRKMHRASKTIRKEEVIQDGTQDEVIDLLGSDMTDALSSQPPQALSDDGDEVQTRDWQDNVSSVESSLCLDDMSESSSSSDESFDLQWGDTLHSWAQNMGHGQLRGVSQTRHTTSVESCPVVLTHTGSPKRGIVGKTGDVDPAITKSVRVISTRFTASSAAKEQDKSVNSGALTALPADEMKFTNVQHSSPAVADRSSKLSKGTPPELDGCNVAMPGVQTWLEHIESSSHRENLEKEAIKDMIFDTGEIPLSKEGNLSVQPKRYTGNQADVESYVDQLITDELNQKVSSLLTKLIEWQERTRQMDPVNAKKKRRYVCGMREASKAVQLGKALAVIVAPNIQPLPLNGGYAYPISALLEECREKKVDIIFALSRRKMGKLLGQRKNASLFALLNVNGAENDLKLLQTMAKDLNIT
ncbi:hypothetical protein M9435_006981 [Picochlorum sp. BPE23]|nr:hypothetical protein M9435_006981 [Picochlorum sp. BPE23]